eukprot:scaffold58161_cov58-Phaeocystis_antarctica.AAC.5
MAHEAISQDRPTRLSSALSFLHRDFEARMYCWEIAEQFKKLFLVGIMVRVQNDTIAQLGVAMIFTMVFMLICVIASPYRKQENDYFAVTSHLKPLTPNPTHPAPDPTRPDSHQLYSNCTPTDLYLCTNCTLCAQVKTVAETLEAGELYDRLYLDEFLIGGLLFACVVGAACLAVPLSFQAMFDAARVPTFKLISTGNRPELELAEGHKWHLFLSHTWGTGQDQCATIKRHLCLLLTGVHVFLDVDDLEDYDALEEYVEQSALIMIFVSKGYFKSKNNLREARPIA